MRSSLGRRALIVGIGLALAGTQGRAEPLAPPKPAEALVKKFVATLGSAAPAAFVEAEVPTVGCPADGQLGPQRPAKLPARLKLRVPAGQQDRLAFYKAEATGGVLAPRGWKCFGVYGSDGDSLIVAPAAGNARLFGLSPPAARGEAVALTRSTGGTSGRFAVATVSARLFPLARKFVEGVRDEGIVDAKDFVFSPWRGDTLDRLSDRAVAYLTPAHATGLGDAAEFAPADLPILGVAFLTGGLDSPDLTVLRARLGAAMDLYPAIAVNALPGEGE